MKEALSTAAMLTIAALATACGSSGSHGNASNAAAASSTPAASSAPSSSSSSSGGGGAYGPYGSGSSSSTSSTSSSSSGSSSTAAKLTTAHTTLGTVLAAGAKGLTVYMFEGDSAGRSNCNGACAGVWPPVVVSGTPSVGGAALKGDVSVITRADGTKQLAYRGHPLYWFSGDKTSGDTNGEGIHGFGHAWYAVSPSGSRA
jgi:predicted lipoprotein with Yx(FWY)xxD motif